MGTERMGTERTGTPRGLERLVFFTDAVAAIAITLLILPLVEAVAESATTAASNDAAMDAALGEFLGEIRPLFVSFIISFVVIARLWVAHHAIFEHVAAYTPRLLVLSLLWTLTIVVLPLPTAIISEFDATPLAVGIYIGTMTLNSLTLTTIDYSVRANPRVESADNPIGEGSVAGSTISTALFIVALVVGVLVPAINLWALLVLLASGPVGVVVRRIRRPR
ncbi:TMEM175 family protein [Marisediminicola senii]|uniref:TMEM175 family protein n=1 Tax=Marisediminicola senii TaxID=2711233 RepID=UPI0013EA8B03|nr:TMEM175 family protein [Marisediminicola senii]